MTSTVDLLVAYRLILAGWLIATAGTSGQIRAGGDTKCRIGIHEVVSKPVAGRW